MAYSYPRQVHSPRGNFTFTWDEERIRRPDGTLRPVEDVDDFSKIEVVDLLVNVDYSVGLRSPGRMSPDDDPLSLDITVTSSTHPEFTEDDLTPDELEYIRQLAYERAEDEVEQDPRD